MPPFTHRFEWIGALALVVGVPALPAVANEQSGIPTVEPDCTEGVMYASDLRKIIEDCIALSGGYESIIVLDGQCYSEGFQGLTEIGNKVIVGAAAASDRKAHPKNNRMHYLDKVITQVATHPNTPLKGNIENGINAMNSGIKNADMPPPPATSAGGDTVVMGKATGGANSVHVVMFAGRVRDSLSRKASKNTFSKMSSTLRNKLSVPDGNVSIAPESDAEARGCCCSKQRLKDEIEAAWALMNSQSQFILILADHGERCKVSKDNIEVPAPDGGTSGAKARIVTSDYMIDQDVTLPTVEVGTRFLDGSTDVTFNGSFIGTLPASGSAGSAKLVFAPQLLAPVGAVNEVFVGTPGGLSAVDRIALTTGPVLGTEFSIPIPALSRRGLIVMALLLLVAGGIVFGRRPRQSRAEREGVGP